MPETQLKQRKTKGGISASKKDVKIGGGGEGSGLKEILEAKEALKENIQMKLTLSSQRRSGGDGESVPDTPPNENSDSVEGSPSKMKNPIRSVPPSSSSSSSSSPLAMASPSDLSSFSVEIRVDLMAVLLLLTGFASRMMFLDRPKHVVFDEMHYGRYASHYLKNTFFFDSNPPLGKLLIALAGYLAGYDGDFGFDKIGVAYPDSVPLWTLRAVPAFCGSLLTPTVYLILSELGLSPWAGAMAGILVLLDSAILAQSRFILLESMMIMFALFALLSVLRFRRYQSTPFSPRWWAWILVAATNMGLAFCVKYLAIYSCWLCCGLLLRDFWARLSDKKLSGLQLGLEFLAQSALVSVVPAVLYIGSFYVHLSLLTKAGVHDSLMTSAFQASLEGGLSSIVKGQPLEIAHGSQITLRHTHGKTCWLHSHEAVYPVRYDDGRGSSHQQQVSCYSYKDVNNWWIVKRPDREDLAVHEPLDIIKDGDTVQLVHGMTHRALNSHDVAAPMSPHNQEISCYIDYNISMASENLWKVDIVNSLMGGGNTWHSIESQVRFIHVNTGQAMKFSPKLLPEWGFNQNEVCGDKVHDQMDTVWNVEEHRYTKNDEDKKSLERELFNQEMIPQKATYLSFWEKFLELQIKMLVTNQENVQNHNYASEPTEWPFLTRGIAYFIAKDSNAQVHLIGNVLVWLSATLALVTYCGLLVVYLLRRRRQCFDLPEATFQQFAKAGEVLLGGYLFHFIPFFFYDRTLFLHHYLTAYIFKLMLTAFVVNHVYNLLRYWLPSRLFSRAFVMLVILWICSAIIVFYKFSVFAFGFYPLSADEVKALKWRETWDFIVHKP